VAASLIASTAVSLGLTADAIGGAPTQWQLLSSFEIQHQLQENWCWAAVTSSVARFFDASSPWKQCAIVNELLGQPSLCCGANGSGMNCNKPWYLDKALERLNNLNSFGSGAGTLAQLQAEIDSGRPIGVRIGWNAFSGHFVVIDGYSANDNGYVNVRDPWFGDSTCEYQEFVERYRGTGAWTHSYWTKNGGESPVTPGPTGTSTPQGSSDTTDTTGVTSTRDWTRWPFG
jgi:Peptidase_C39 like family